MKPGCLASSVLKDKGRKPPDEFPTQDALLAPLAFLTEAARVHWGDEFRNELIRLELTGYLSPPPKPKESQDVLFVPAGYVRPP